MIQIDLITGFLGSGKTTFLIQYAKRFMNEGAKVGIIENDFGAVNVDMLLLQDLVGDYCELEMISGGCDIACHRRRFKTKLISMGMRGFSRIIVEPSGIFDVDEFFDLLHEEPLDRWYEIGNVITIVDACLEADMSKQADYLLASQLARAGQVIFSRSQNATLTQMSDTIAHVNNAMEMIQCKRRFTMDDMITKPWDEWGSEEYARVRDSGYVREDFVKFWFHQNEVFQSVYFLNMQDSIEHVKKGIQQVFTDSECGNVFRIKGFLATSQQNWLEINATRQGISLQERSKGQDVLIVIGEKLNEDRIRQYFVS